MKTICVVTRTYYAIDLRGEIVTAWKPTRERAWMECSRKYDFQMTSEDAAKTQKVSNGNGDFRVVRMGAVLEDVEM